MEDSQGSSGRVLLVQDDPDLILFLRHFLERSGFAVETAASIEEAQERWEGPPPDAAVTDLPGSHDPLPWPSVPVLTLTGDARPRSTEPQVAQERMLKPADPYEIVGWLKKKAGKPGAA